jgi:hypothetical protein
METSPQTPANRRICAECGGAKKAHAKKCRACYYARGYKICSEPRCTNRAITRGLCNAHRLRLKRNGTTEHLCLCGAQATNRAGRPRCDQCRDEGKAATQRKAALRNLYGLSWDDYCALLASQDNGCAICGSTVPGRRGHAGFGVDHDHATGRIRGLLCHACNVGIGYFNDDADVLLKAVTYLRAAV